MKYTDYIEINETFQYSINLQFDINNIEKIKQYIPTNDSCEIIGYYLDSILGKFNKEELEIYKLELQKYKRKIFANVREKTA